MGIGTHENYLDIDKGTKSQFICLMNNFIILLMPASTMLCREWVFVSSVSWASKTESPTGPQCIEMLSKNFFLFLCNLVLLSVQYGPKWMSFTNHQLMKSGQQNKKSFSAINCDRRRRFKFMKRKGVNPSSAASVLDYPLWSSPSWCLNGPKSLEFRVTLWMSISKVLTDWVTSLVSQWVTRSPIELFWTAKKEHLAQVGDTGPPSGNRLILNIHLMSRKMKIPVKITQGRFFFGLHLWGRSRGGKFFRSASFDPEFYPCDTSWLSPQSDFFLFSWWTPIPLLNKTRVDEILIHHLL